VPSQSWRITGPYAASEASQRDQQVLHEPGTLTWRNLSAVEIDADQLNFAGILGKHTDAVVYAETVFALDRPLRLEVRAGSDDGMTVWLDGRTIIDAPKPRAFKAGENRTELTLQPGEHRLVYRVNQGAGAWKGQVRVYDVSRRPAMPLILKR
jgi:hypothetical protein